MNRHASWATALDVLVAKPPAPAEGEKQCTSCFQIKPLADFRRRTARNGGHRSACRSCEDERDALAKELRKYKDAPCP